MFWILQSINDIYYTLQCWTGHLLIMFCRYFDIHEGRHLKRETTLWCRLFYSSVILLLLYIVHVFMILCKVYTFYWCNWLPKILFYLSNFINSVSSIFFFTVWNCILYSRKKFMLLFGFHFINSENNIVFV